MQSTNLRNRFSTALREPVVHFLLLGAALYALYGLAGPSAPDESPNRITVTAGEINWLTSTWEKRWNRPPTPEERAGLIQEYVRESIFYREALAMGLDRDDTIIRRRLAQKLEFLSQDLVATIPPTEEQLRTYFAEHAQRYEHPSLTTFTHVFVDPDRRGERTLADAEAMGAELREQGPPAEGADGLGDPFMLQRYYPERSELELSKLFGGEFARSVSRLEPGAWQGPVRSGYGLHWVFVEARSEAETPAFAEARERVEQDWRDDRRREFDEAYYASLRARYEVVIEGDPVDDLAGVRGKTR
jgi:hypothetical protein